MSIERMTELMELYSAGVYADVDNISGHIDAYSEALTGFASTISSDHNYIHQGLGFSLVATVSALAAAGVSKIGFTTPNLTPAKYLHWRPAQFSSSGNAARYRLYEDAAFTGGTNAQPINRNRNKTAVSNVIFYTGATAALTGNLTVTTKAGGGFGNQPAGAKVTAVSDNNVEDKIPTLTVYGTVTGSTATVTTNVIQLNGTTPVDSALSTFQNILGCKLSAACTGTVTLSSAGGTIITIAAGTLKAGIETPSILNCSDQILTMKASDTSTAPVGVIGTVAAGTAITSVIALNGTNSVSINSTLFNTISEVLIGAVAGTRTVSVTIPNKILASATCGSGATSSRSGGVGGGSDLELVLKPNTPYVAYLENIGASTATDIDIDFFFYEELGGGA